MFNPIQRTIETPPKNVCQSSSDQHWEESKAELYFPTIPNNYFWKEDEIDLYLPLEDAHLSIKMLKKSVFHEIVLRS